MNGNTLRGSNLEAGDIGRGASPRNTVFRSQELHTVSTYKAERKQFRSTEFLLREAVAEANALIHQKDKLIQQLKDRLIQQSKVLSKFSARHKGALKRIAELTPRQREIMAMILAGYRNKNIAADLHISQRTVENHRAAIMRKTGLKSLPELTLLVLAAAWNGADGDALCAVPERGGRSGYQRNGGSRVVCIV